MGVFSQYQPLYAEHGIATFPLTDSKIPATKGWNRVGAKGSSELAEKFSDADGFGFVTNKRNKITVLDIDITDEKVMTDALLRHGETPLIIQTASGKWHLYYASNGERRRIRPFGDVPIDLLGAGGLAVAAPTLLAKGSYRFIEGSFDDLGRLPTMRGLDASMYVKPPSIPTTPDEPTGLIPEGTCNTTLWRMCIAEAAQHRIKTGNTIDRRALIEMARRCNAESAGAGSD